MAYCTCNAYCAVLCCTVLHCLDHQYCVGSQAFLCARTSTHHSSLFLTVTHLSHRWQHNAPCVHARHVLQRHTPLTAGEYAGDCVAVKLLPITGAFAEDSRKEACLGLCLNHPNIVRGAVAIALCLPLLCVELVVAVVVLSVEWGRGRHVTEEMEAVCFAPPQYACAGAGVTVYLRAAAPVCLRR